MKFTRVLSWSAIAVLAVAGTGCKNQNQNDAAQPLTQSFEAAEPATKRAIETVAANLTAGNYTEAARTLSPIVNQPNLTGPQKQAIGLALHQMNQAIAKNPALDTKEMYELRKQMFRAVDGGPRF